MILFVLNFFLAIVWTVLSAEFTAANFALGYAIGLGMMWLGKGAFPLEARRYFGLVRRVPRAITFLGYFAVELVKASVRVLWEALTPRHYMVPGVIGIPLEADTDLEIALLANFITLTPGTLSLAVSPDRKTLYIHAMYIDDEDVERFKQGIKDGFERRLLEVLR